LSSSLSATWHSFNVPDRAAEAECNLSKTGEFVVTFAVANHSDEFHCQPFAGASLRLAEFDGRILHGPGTLRDLWLTCLSTIEDEVSVTVSLFPTVDVAKVDESRSASSLSVSAGTDDAPASWPRTSVNGPAKATLPQSASDFVDTALDSPVP
jgi:hypothetical protein